VKRLLEGLMKGLALWLYGLFLEIVEFIADSLLQVFNMDLAYFEANVPVTREIVSIIIAAGWAILIGNLAFQAMKSMMSGIGFEGEDPKILFCRTFVFSFLLLASRQICEIGLGMTSKLNTLLQTPDAVRLSLPPLDIFVIPGSWLLVIIMGIILMFQIVKFFFEIAERYVVLVMLTILAPLAFGVGGSKNTEDIFKGWARMFGSSCLMMLFNTVFLKLLLSAMSNMPSAAGMLPWMLLVVAIARVARKIDEIVARIGLNTARTGDPIGRGGIMYPIMVARTLGGIVSKTATAGKTPSGTPPSGRQPGGGTTSSPPPPPPPAPGPASGGAAPQQPQSSTGGISAPSGMNGAGTSGPASVPPGAQPAMSATMPGSGGTGKEPPPSRPPVGAGKNGRRPGIFGNRSEQSDAAGSDRTGSGKPPLSVDSAVPGGIHTERPENDRPPLSVDSRTPDSAGADRANAQKRAKPRKSANIDIFRDDDTISGSHGAGGHRPAPANVGRPAASSGQSSRTSGGSQTVSHTDTRSARVQRNVQESWGNTANVQNAAAAPGTGSPQAPPSRASSPGAGRIGGLSQSGGLNQSQPHSGGATVPGAAHRPASAVTPAPRNIGYSEASAGGASPRPTPADAGVTRRNTYAASGGNRPAAHTDSPSSASRQVARAESGTPASASTRPGSSENTQAAHPMRYRRVERNMRQQPDNTDGQDTGQSGARPAPGVRPPGRGPSPGGGNRP